MEAPKPKTREELQTVLKGIVNNLPATPDGIAALFRAKACTGRRGSAYACPLARHVREETGIDSVQVDSWGITVFGTNSPTGFVDATFPHVGATYGFMKQFDNGLYPDLIRKD